MTRAELNAYIIANIYPNGRNEVTAPMVRDPMLAVVAFMGDAATYGVGGVAAGNGGLVTGGQVYSAINTALSSAVKFQGVTTTALTDGSTNPVITIDGESYTAHKGDEVIYGGREFLWTGSKWQQLGDEESWALKTITISAGAGLSGGGDLTQNRTLSLSQDSLEKLALAASAYQLPGTGIPLADLAAGVQNSLGKADSAYQLPQGGIPKTDLASAVQNSLGKADTVAGYFSNDKLKLQNLPDLYLARTQVSGTASNKTIYGVNAISYAGSYDANDKSLIEWDDTNKVWHVHGGLYAEGVLSGGGLSQSTPGGGGGLDPALMWKYLTNDPTLSSNPYANTKIADAHLPDLNPGTGVSASYSGNLYLNLSLNYSAVAGQLGLSGMAYKPADQQTIVDALGYTPVNPSSLGSFAYKNSLSVSDIPDLSGTYLSLAGGTMTGNILLSNEVAIVWSPTFTSYIRMPFRINDGTHYTGINLYNSGGLVYTKHGVFTNRYGEGNDGNSIFLYPNDAPKIGTNYIWHAGNLTKSVLTGLLDASGGYYLPLTGGTIDSTSFGALCIKRGASSGNSTNIKFQDGNTISGYLGFQYDNGNYTPGYWDAATNFNYFYHSGNFNPGNYLPLTGGTISNASAVPLNINATSGVQSAIVFQLGGTNASQVGHADNKFGTWLYDYTSGAFINITHSGALLYNNTYTIYHANNSNKSDVSWNCSTLVANGQVQLYANNAANYGYIRQTDASFNISRIIIGSCYGYYSPVDAITIMNGKVGIGIGDTTPAYELDVAGVIHASTGIWTEGYLSGGGLSQSSDQRLKRFIEDFSYNPGMLMALRPREWEWNDMTPMEGHAAGFVAQEVEGLLPYMVDNTREYLSLYYDQFHALEVSALQDHERRIVELEKAVEDRDRQIAELRQRLNMN